MITDAGVKDICSRLAKLERLWVCTNHQHSAQCGLTSFGAIDIPIKLPHLKSLGIGTTLLTGGYNSLDFETVHAIVTRMRNITQLHLRKPNETA